MPLLLDDEYNPVRKEQWPKDIRSTIMGSYVLKILRVCCGKIHQPGLALGIGLICLMITLQRDLFVLPTSALTGNRNQYYQIISKGHGHENAGQGQLS